MTTSEQEQSTHGAEGIEKTLEAQEVIIEKSPTTVDEIKGFRFVLVVGALLSAVFCVALDNTSMLTFEVFVFFSWELTWHSFGDSHSSNH
jgi:hypothetical protein